MSSLTAPESFSFPFPPYNIQEDFMKSLFKTLEEGKLGIFESPTGTGKSLSLICGALTWLNEHNVHHKKELEKKVEEAEKEQGGDDGPDWFTAATKRREGQKETSKFKEELLLLEKQEQRVKQLRERRQVIKRGKFQKQEDEFDELFRDLQEVRESVQRELKAIEGSSLSAEESELLLDDYHSDDESDTGSKWNKKDKEDEQDDGCLKIYFCSRTHSQLSQFVREVQKTSFSEEVRVVSLASRQNLCVNEEVSKLSNTSLINDRCLDMQRSKKGTATSKASDGTTTKKKKSSSGCPYHKHSALEKFADQILLQVQDIEQMVAAGRKHNSCPYYGGRFAIKDSQLVCLPYNTLLHKGTREASGINLHGNVVIVDEAHNLLETIAGIHSVVLSHSQLAGAFAQLTQYQQRYEKRVSPRNLLYIKQILFFINALIKLLTGSTSQAKESKALPTQTMMTVPNFLCDTLVDNLNIFKLIKYIEGSKIAHKLHSFSKTFEGLIKIRHSNINDTKKSEQPPVGSSTSAFLAKMKQNGKSTKENLKPSEDKTQNLNSDKNKKDEEEIVMGSPLMQVTEFLRALLATSADGRVVVQIGNVPRKSYVKYLLLNPASHFHDIVQQCRSVIVAGGTMRPMNEFSEQLFLSAGARPERVQEFSCGHVVPGEQLMPIALTQGPTNVTLDFTFGNRNNPTILDELGRVIVNICTVVPGGVVCFLPSYDYEEKVCSHFESSGVIQRLSNKKKVFREPKKSNQLDTVLADYAKTIRLSSSNSTGVTGALMFSVVGGKMSEGINFNDGLGRCVVMVGLPYPNSHSAELKEKMNYLNKHATGSGGKTAGSVFYENLCFKAVNQSIGRAIRHKNDYASILLLDHRYCRPASIKALPEWISKHLRQSNKFGHTQGLLRKFFSDKKTSNL